MRLLANENFPISSVRSLLELGYDIRAIGTDYPGVSDEYVLTLAEKEERTIVTFDRDYGELIFRMKLRPPNGVIFLRLDQYTPDGPALIVHRLFTEFHIKADFALSVFDGIILRQRKY